MSVKKIKKRAKELQERKKSASAALFQQASQAHQAGNMAEAERLYREVLAKVPGHTGALQMLGGLALQTGRNALAIDLLTRAIALDPRDPFAYCNLAVAATNLGDCKQAVAWYAKAIPLLGQKNDLARAYFEMGNACKSAALLEDAATAFQKALVLRPDLFMAHNNLGNVLQHLGDLDRAETHFRRALEIKPDDYKTLHNLGKIRHEQGQLDDAIAFYNQALQFQPDNPGTLCNLGIVFRDHDKFDEAMLCFKRARQIAPNDSEALGNLVDIKERQCDWEGLSELKALLRDQAEKALARGQRTAETPFMSLTHHADPPYNAAVAASWSRGIARAVAAPQQQFPVADRRHQGEKIVIGYLSNDFHDHATAHLMLGLFGLHDRERFTVHCYSYDTEDSSRYRRKIEADCDRFINIRPLDATKAAQCIHDHGVNILVDLKGFTKDTRLEICAHRPAPIQVNYLGFPGTIGADFFDYIIADPIVAPLEHASYYSEKIAHLPHCYQVNDNRQAIARQRVRRSDAGLPDCGFVFCSFNNSLKIEPVTFDTWMRILKKVPESVLWLLPQHETTARNLRQAAETRGVSARRLIFAGKLPKPEHLARLQLADLALDTRLYNGHTTSSDALWAGTPVLTLKGQHFASRVSASILTAVGLPEMITADLTEYETMAVELATSPARLAQVRQKLAKNRLTTPLFDTERFTRDLETLYLQMWKIYLAGESPRPIQCTPEKPAGR